MKASSPELMPSIAVPVKLLTVVQLIPALHSGGAERSALEIARALVQAGHRSVVISAGGRLADQLQAEGSEHITLDLGRKSLGTLTRLGALRRVLRELKPDIVHARSRLPAWRELPSVRNQAAFTLSASRSRSSASCESDVCRTSGS